MQAKISHKLQEPYIIAEMSANHNQNLEKAKKFIYAAKDAGADAIKLQTFHADTVTIDIKNELFKIDSGTLWDDMYLYDLYDKAYLPWRWHQELFDLAQELKIDIFSTVTDKSSVDFLESLNTPAYKLASFEITDIPLIEYTASKQKPIILSTGIADYEDIKLAIESCRKMGNEQIYLLKCTSQYPAPLESMNLQTITDMKKKFNVEVGLSDHTQGFLAPVLAVALGAMIIEKHFILDKKDPGLDREFSLNPTEFSEMVKQIRNTQKLLGKVNYKLNEKTQSSKEQFARSLFVIQDIQEGEVFNEKNMKSIRPNGGLHPKYFNSIISKKASKFIQRGTPLSWEHIQ